MQARVCLHIFHFLQNIFQCNHDFMHKNFNDVLEHTNQPGYRIFILVYGLCACARVATDVVAFNGVAEEVDCAIVFHSHTRTDQRRILGQGKTVVIGKVIRGKTGSGVDGRRVKQGGKDIVIAVVGERIACKKQFFKTVGYDFGVGRNNDIVCDKRIVDIEELEFTTVDDGVVVETEAVFPRTACTGASAAVVIDRQAVTHGIVVLTAVIGAVAHKTGVVMRIDVLIGAVVGMGVEVNRHAIADVLLTCDFAILNGAVFTAPEPHGSGEIQNFAVFIHTKALTAVDGSAVRNKGTVTHADDNRFRIHVMEIAMLNQHTRVVNGIDFLFGFAPGLLRIVPRPPENNTVAAVIYFTIGNGQIVDRIAASCGKSFDDHGCSCRCGTAAEIITGSDGVILHIVEIKVVERDADTGFVEGIDPDTAAVGCGDGKIGNGDIRTVNQLEHFGVKISFQNSSFALAVRRNDNRIFLGAFPFGNDDIAVIHTAVLKRNCVPGPRSVILRPLTDCTAVACVLPSLASFPFTASM